MDSKKSYCGGERQNGELFVLPMLSFQSGKMNSSGISRELMLTLKNYLSKYLDFAINYRENYLIGNIKSD